MAIKHIDFISPEEKKKWLRQRNWEEDGMMWRDPDSGIRYNFTAAINKAKEGCRVPADYELRPV